MTPWIIIGICVALIVGAVIGWKARDAKDEFDRELDRIFYEALKESE